MSPHRARPGAVSALCAAVLASAAGACGHPPSSSPTDTLMGHTVRVDADRKLLSWSHEGSPYAHVARLAWRALETQFPVQDTGYPTYLTYSRFDPQTHDGFNWPHNPAGLYAMLTDSAVLWYAFSGDAAAVELVRGALDHQLSRGTTAADWDWARVPFASGNAGDADYAGADDAWCDFCGRGDGVGVIEPDKVGELGYAYLQLFELTGDERYRDAAVACADALASHVREGDRLHSPWPFRVYARTNVVREEYSANVVGALMLFDELGRQRVGDVDAYARARTTVVDWLMRVPMQSDAWSGYFEDIEIQTDPQANPNQYSALRTARWLLQHPEVDPRWRDRVAHLLEWVAQTFGADTATERGTQWGATVLSEQTADMAKMGSHTARYGAANALWYEATGDLTARDRAARSLAWATYACDPGGIVAVGEDAREGYWFSDGYGDYIRHFLVAMAAVPDWAPPGESHLLRSTSIATQVEYVPARVTWSTFDADATDTLRLASRPARVTAAGDTLAERADVEDQGYVVRPLASGGVLLRVRHRARGPVVVTTSSPGASPDAGGAEDPAPGATAASGCALGRREAAASAAGLAALAAILAGLRRKSAGPRRRR